MGGPEEIKTLQAYNRRWQKGGGFVPRQVFEKMQAVQRQKEEIQNRRNKVYL